MNCKVITNIDCSVSLPYLGLPVIVSHFLPIVFNLTPAFQIILCLYVISFIFCLFFKMVKYVIPCIQCNILNSFKNMYVNTYPVSTIYIQS